MCLYNQLCLEFAITEHLYEMLGRNETCSNQLFDANLLQVLGFSQSLQSGKVDGLVLYTVDVLETELGQTALQRHLTAFKTDFLAITRTLLGTFVTTRRRTALARTGTATNTLA